MIEVRECVGFEELDACVELQNEIWGVDPRYTTPRKGFLLAQKVGGQVVGAFDTERPVLDGSGAQASLVGFVMALPGIKNGDGTPRAYLHSNMLAVRESYRNRGIGARLKLEQRREALQRGIRLMEWTFDPLEIKNAFLNIHKLGAVVCAYRENFYGVSSSRLQGGLPTDRLLAEWHLDSPRVRAVVEGHRAVAEVSAERILERITVPASIYEWKATAAGQELALAVQSENRSKFKEAFSRGLAVLGYVRDGQGNGVFELGLPSQAEQATRPKERETL